MRSVLLLLFLVLPESYRADTATCHPGFEEKLTGAITSTDPVVTDGNVITSRGMGTSIDFALAIVKYLKDDAAVEELCQKLVYKK